MKKRHGLKPETGTDAERLTELTAGESAIVNDFVDAMETIGLEDDGGISEIENKIEREGLVNTEF